jgi:signal transduction histidine kinase
VMPKLFMLDARQPLGRGFRERRAINVTDPGSLHIIERDDDPVPPDKLAVPRASYDRTHGHPFACSPLLGSQGEPVGALCISSYHGGQPIPDAMLSHGVLRAIIDLLAMAMERALQAERIARLNACLVKSQAAIASDARIKTVGELAAAVAHDLNNLSGIALLAASVGSRSAADAVDTMPRIERAIRAIGDLVARLQRIARRPSSDGEVANLTQVVEDIVVIVKPLLREQSIEIEADLPAVPPVRCDAVLIHQVVLNLVINATEALAEMPTDRRRIRIVLRDDIGAVRLSVADTGPGIAPAVLAQLFQPFITTKRDAHLGLGLAAAHGSLKHAGGEIEGRNAPAGGAVFEVTLPVAPPSAAVEASPEPARPAPSDPAQRARIFAIDDDVDIVDIIRVNLELEGYVVATATGSAQAIAIASGQAFDLVLCDIGMPKQNGIDVCRSLRDGGYRGKLVLMTGWDHYALNNDQRALDCDALLKKPFVGSELIGVIESVLQGGDGERRDA